MVLLFGDGCVSLLIATPTTVVVLFLSLHATQLTQITRKCTHASVSAHTHTTACLCRFYILRRFPFHVAVLSIAIVLDNGF